MTTINVIKVKIAFAIFPNFVFEKQTETKKSTKAHTPTASNGIKNNTTNLN